MLDLATPSSSISESDKAGLKWKYLFLIVACVHSFFHHDAFTHELTVIILPSPKHIGIFYDMMSLSI